ncbi:MAG: hypothetical protein ACI9CD_000408, partial [Candidatus Deianiraeaceae bacterium]
MLHFKKKCVKICAFFNEKWRLYGIIMVISLTTHMVLK